MAPKRSRGSGSNTNRALHDEDGEVRAQPAGISANMLPTNLHPWLRFSPTLAKYNEFCDSLQGLLGKNIVAPRVVDWEPLETVRLAQPVRDLITQQFEFGGEAYTFIDWESLFGIQVPIYRELCLEFYSTYQFRSTITSTVDRDFMRFRLGGRAQSMSMQMLAQALGIYTQDELDDASFDAYLSSGARIHSAGYMDTDAVWAEFSQENYVASATSYLDINEVEYRIIHRFLAHTIALRKENTEKVNLSDLWYLQQFRSRRHVNIPYCVASYMQQLGRGIRATSPICGGHFITLIARHLGVNLGAASRLTTSVDTPFGVIGSVLYSKARVISIRNGRVYPFQENLNVPHQQRRRANRQPEQPQHVPPQQPDQQQPPHQDFPAQPYLADIMAGIQGLRVGQESYTTRLDGFGQRFDDFGHQLAGHGQQLAGYGDRLDTFGHQLVGYGTDLHAYGQRQDAFDYRLGGVEYNLQWG